MSAEITVSEIYDHIFLVKLNRPQKMNTVNLTMWRLLKSQIDTLAENPRCRVIILAGEGRAFCAGIDFQEGLGEIIRMVQDDSVDVGRKGRFIYKFAKEVQDYFSSLEKCAKPVIAAIHAYCLGVGTDLITACDIRYATKDTQFSVKEIDFGLASDMGVLNRIQQVVGNASWCREIAMSAKHFGADEALRFGLVSRIFEDQKSLLEGAIELAKTIAKKSPIAVQGTKKILYYSKDHSTSDSLNFVATWNMSQLLTSDIPSALSSEKFEDV